MSYETLRSMLLRLTEEGGFLRVRAVMALGLTGAMIYAFVTDKGVPEELFAAWGIAAAFYFGSRTNRNAN